MGGYKDLSEYKGNKQQLPVDERDRGDTDTGSKLLIDEEGLTPISLKTKAKVQTLT